MDFLDGMNNLFNSPSLQNLLLSSSSSGTSKNRTPIAVPDTPVILSSTTANTGEESPFFRPSVSTIRKDFYNGTNPHDLFRQGSITHSYLTKTMFTTTGIPSLLAPVNGNSNSNNSSSLSRSKLKTEEYGNPLASLEENSLRTPMNILLKRELLSSSSVSSPSSLPFHLPLVPSSTAKVPFENVQMDVQQLKETIAASIPEYNPNVTLDQINYARQQVDDAVSLYQQSQASSIEEDTTRPPAAPIVNDIIRNYGKYSSLLANMLVIQSESAEKMKVAQLDIIDKEWKAMNKANEEFSQLLTKEMETRTTVQTQYDDLLVNFEKLVAYCTELEKENNQLLLEGQEGSSVDRTTEALGQLRDETIELRTTIQQLQCENTQLIEKLQQNGTQNLSGLGNDQAAMIERIHELEQQIVDATTAIENHRQQNEAMQNRMTELLVTLANRDEQVSNLQVSVRNTHGIPENEDILLSYSPHSVADETVTGTKQGFSHTEKRRTMMLNDSSVSPKGSSILMNSFALSASKFGQSGTNNNTFRMFSPSTKDAVETFVLLNQLSNEIGALANTNRSIEKPDPLAESFVLSPSIPVTQVLSPAVSTPLTESSRTSTKLFHRVQELTESLRQRIVELTNERDSLRVRCDELTVQTTTLREATAASVCAVMNIPTDSSVAANRATPFKSPESPESHMNGGLFSPSSFLSPTSASTARSAREATLAALSADNRKLNEKMVTLQAIVDSQAREISRIASTLATTKATVMDYERKIEALHTDSANKDTLIDSLRNDIGTKSSEYSRTRDELNTANTTIGRMEDEVQRKNTELENLRKYIESLEDSSYQSMMQHIAQPGLPTTNKENGASLSSDSKASIANVIASIPVNSTSECPMPTPSSSMETTVENAVYEQQLRSAHDRIEALEREIFTGKQISGTATHTVPDQLSENTSSVIHKIMNSSIDVVTPVMAKDTAVSSSTGTEHIASKALPSRSQSRGRVGLRRVVVRTTGDIEMEYEPEQTNGEEETVENRPLSSSGTLHNPRHYDIHLSTGTGKTAWSSLPYHEANSQLSELAAKLRGTKTVTNSAPVGKEKRQFPSRSVSRTTRGPLSSSGTAYPTNNRIPELLHQTEDQLAQDNIDGKPVDETLVQVRERLLYLLNKQSSRSSSVLRAEPRTTNVPVPATSTTVAPSTTSSHIPRTYTPQEEQMVRPSLPILNPSATLSSVSSSAAVTATALSSLPMIPSMNPKSIISVKVSADSGNNGTNMPQKPTRPLRAIQNHGSHTSYPSTVSTVTEVSTAIPIFSSSNFSTVSSPVSSASLSESIMIFKAIEEEKALRARLANGVALSIPSATFINSGGSLDHQTSNNDSNDDWTDLIPASEQ